MKKKGQHFLVDRSALERIAQYAELCKEDRVLEIGAGTGNLTEVLAERSLCVYAVEIYPHLAMGLQGMFQNVRVIKGDALEIELPDYNKIVSNLPYQISSKITYRLLSRPFELAVLMFQQEFAKRLVATVGSREYGRLAMVAGFFCEAKILEILPRSAFRPVPEVNSAIVRLLPRSVRPDVKPEVFLRLVEGLFRQRRKKVKKALAALGVSKEKLAGIDSTLLDKRPEELTPDQAAELAIAIHLFN
ncbi:MAG: 16S rRNA (adenine(1518)-N(6)/adenine(1519)-N(6))-dimethyltransferase RsmA [Methanothrix sp.]|nr:16S rRNA (adenine(1518)-N(6)/adenine(1519)-N(6))-dimethyltransferase RsmA [Methanothrix sp.]